VSIFSIMKSQFNVRRLRLVFALFFATGVCCAPVSASADSSFNDGWRFVRADEPGAKIPGFNDDSWEVVTLPHTARVEALVTGGEDQQWQGTCWYRRTFDLSPDASNKVVILRFEGAMNTADVWVNGESAGRFMGGYLPYVMDISGLAKPGAGNVIAVCLDNRDNAITGPKPLKDLDFNLYGGLYRPAELVIKDKLHITDPILAGKVASGGLFVTFPEVTKEAATVRVQTHVRNADDTRRNPILRTTLIDPKGVTVATLQTGSESLAAGTDRELVQEIRVPTPKLWSPNSPHLYTVRTELLENESVVDAEITRIGIRHLRITNGGLWMNGERVFLRGANRHQEYPYIGNALSDAAQYRDALKIKQAGFDYVRLSHYPQSPAFLDACDELGLVVMNCLMGWQFFNPDPAFATLKYEECRELIRRDRNHPCVILWEVSLNESRMPDEFIRQTHAIGREEYPGDQCFTCGWTDGYDVFIQARQHGGCRGATNRPCVISEYGDWEYHAQNAGLAQHLWTDLQPAERSSRQLRGYGETRLLQQALNFQEAHNDNLKTTAFADGIWVMYDYNRGYAADIEASGVMDIFRLPKFGYWFFRSQREPDEIVAGEPVGPMAFIASHWTPQSPLEVRVFSNCDEVELHVNGRLLERRAPDKNRFSTHVKHPPFTFTLGEFEPGTLRAVGFMDGQPVAVHERRTPSAPVQLALRFDLGHRPFAAHARDSVFCYAELFDEAGTQVSDTTTPVSFGAVGEARLVGHNPILAEAGIATRLLESDRARPDCHVYALCLVSTEQGIKVLSASASPDASVPPPYEIRYTTDGGTPTPDSSEYDEAISDASEVCAALFVGGTLVAKVDTRVTAASSGRFATGDQAATTSKAREQAAGGSTRKTH